MFAYIKAKKERGGGEKIYDQVAEDRDNQEFCKNEFSLDEFQYSKNDKSQGFEKIEQMSFVPKQSKKAVKIGQPWKVIDK